MQVCRSRMGIVANNSCRNSRAVSSISLKKRLDLALEVDGFAAPIVLRVLALDPAAAFQAGEQPGQGRFFYAEPFRQVALGQMAAARWAMVRHFAWLNPSGRRR